MSINVDEPQTQITNPGPPSYDSTRVVGHVGLHNASIRAKEVAQLAGVSIATVSRVANGASSVAGKTKAKVLAAIDALQYCPNQHAVNLGRATAGLQRNRRVDIVARRHAKGKATFDSEVDMRRLPSTNYRLHLLEDEAMRVRKLIDDLNVTLTRIKTIQQ